jgi:hypothetical protein
VNLLDENINEDQHQLLLKWRIHVRQIGRDAGVAGMKDSEIIPFLHQLSQTTFFNSDRDFSRPNLCHPNYCLVYLIVEEAEVAQFVRRVLRHPELNSRAKRMGKVIRVTRDHLYVWQWHSNYRETPDWPA